MFVETLNFYSLIIPLFMIVLGSTIVGFSYFKDLPRYFVVHGHSTYTVAFALLLYSILDPQHLTQAACLTSILLYISCAQFYYAASLRLKVGMNWPFVLISIGAAELLMFYYSWIEDVHLVRLLLLGVVPCLIFAHNLTHLYALKLRKRLDQFLRLSLVILMAIVILRIGYLVFALTQTQITLSSSWIFATGQFMILAINIGLVVLLLCCAFQDISHQLRQERNLDPLTGLLNRRALHESLRRLKHQPDSVHALLVCDLDHFKQINDQYGHQVGDLALKHASQIMTKSVSRYDEVARIGGEEFAILLRDTTQETAIEIAEKIRATLEHHPLYVSGQAVPLTISIGVSFFEHRHEFEYALQRSDTLLYQAKKYGRNKVEWLFIP